MPLPLQDREILRGLARELADIAALPVQKERAGLWTALNSLQPTRPLIYINEIPWDELNVNDELTTRCQDAWARGLEWGMRAQLYQWRHFPGDMVVNPWFWSPMHIHQTGFGLEIDAAWVATEGVAVASREYHGHIKDFSDADRITTPVVTHDKAASDAELERRTELLGDIMPVKQRGIAGQWFSPWDLLIQVWGVEQAMMDLVLKPDLVNHVMTRLVDAYMGMLKQWEDQNLLSPNIYDDRVGSGGYGFTSELPAKGFDPAHVRTIDLWGCATAQIFVSVSPKMHWEFALKHEMRWLEKWGLTYYGCCEPLDIKMGILRRIPNLRKVSMSPWVKPERGAAELKTDYVYSHKPNPAILAEDVWRPDQARRELIDVLDRIKGCRVEVILKDVSTVRRQPQRLWEWAKIAAEVVQQYAP
ncbi:MAG: hypothetical protein ABFD92_08820 [Planctomycetaceae bacterium]|nr:hypothetical protein [Planctomycetaceae bacterium]